MRRRAPRRPSAVSRERRRWNRLRDHSFLQGERYSSCSGARETQAQGDVIGVIEPRGRAEISEATDVAGEAHRARYHGARAAECIAAGPRSRQGRSQIGHADLAALDTWRLKVIAPLRRRHHRALCRSGALPAAIRPRREAWCALPNRARACGHYLSRNEGSGAQGDSALRCGTIQRARVQAKIARLLQTLDPRTRTAHRDRARKPRRQLYPGAFVR